jgi:hypothetical protein
MTDQHEDDSIAAFKSEGRSLPLSRNDNGNSGTSLNKYRQNRFRALPEIRIFARELGGSARRTGVYAESK